MRKVASVLALCLLLLACKGKQGPMGPAGPQGPPGAAITCVTGIITVTKYEGGFLVLVDEAISPEEFIQVFVTPDSDEWAWLLIESFQVLEGALAIYDPARDFMGYEYMILIIENVDT
jgi:hypothetical protein